MANKVYLNGELLDVTRAAVEVSNPSLLHGVGLFETLRSYDGRPFRLNQHIARLTSSAGRFNMPVDEAVEQIPDAVAAVLKANNLKNARIRFTVTPSGIQDQRGRTTLLVAAQAVTGYPPALYEKGMTVYACTDYRQSAHDPLAGHKTTSYFARLIALRDAQDRNCGEALWFTPDNLLAEGSISNVFLVKDGRLKSPPLGTPVLPGITRATILELAPANDVPAGEGACTIDDLLDADEVFLTNSIMEVMPVTRVEQRPIGGEKPGPVTRKLADAYQELTRTA